MTPFMMALGSNLRSKIDAFFSFYIFCNMNLFCEAKITIPVAPFIYTTFLEYVPFNYWFWSKLFSPDQLGESCLMFYFLIFERSFVISIPFFEVLSCTNIYMFFPLYWQRCLIYNRTCFTTIFQYTFFWLSAITVFFWNIFLIYYLFLD